MPFDIGYNEMIICRNNVLQSKIVSVEDIYTLLDHERSLSTALVSIENLRDMIEPGYKNGTLTHLESKLICNDLSRILAPVDISLEDVEGTEVSMEGVIDIIGSILKAIGDMISKIASTIAGWFGGGGRSESNSSLATHNSVGLKQVIEVKADTQSKQTVSTAPLTMSVRRTKILSVYGYTVDCKEWVTELNKIADVLKMEQNMAEGRLKVIELMAKATRGFTKETSQSVMKENIVEFEHELIKYQNIGIKLPALAGIKDYDKDKSRPKGIMLIGNVGYGGYCSLDGKYVRSKPSDGLFFVFDNFKITADYWKPKLFSLEHEITNVSLVVPSTNTLTSINNKCKELTDVINVNKDKTMKYVKEIEELTKKTLNEFHDVIPDGEDLRGQIEYIRTITKVMGRLNSDNGRMFISIHDHAEKVVEGMLKFVEDAVKLRSSNKLANIRYKDVE